MKDKGVKFIKQLHLYYTIISSTELSFHFVCVMLVKAHFLFPVALKTIKVFKQKLKASKFVNVH